MDPQGAGAPGGARLRLVLDVETDGLGSFRPPAQRVIQLAYGAWAAGADCAPASVLVRGAREVHPRALEVHGIAPAALEERGVPLAEAVSGLLAALAPCDVVVGHNVEFDLGCLFHSLRAEGLPAEAEALERALRTKRVACTMRSGLGVSRLCGAKFPSLAELHRALFRRAPDPARLHDAAYDCVVTARCYDALFPEPDPSDRPRAKKPRLE
jgi:DNA polymerase III epsilon subunit-like protein